LLVTIYASFTEFPEPGKDPIVAILPLITIEAPLDPVAPVFVAEPSTP
jgi:hypothetical protein